MLKTPDAVDPAFRADVLAGLAEPIPSIPARWLYDLRGSELFDDITRLDAYYPTRTETALLEAKMPEIARLVGPDTAIVEFGSGSSTKTPLLLEAVKPRAYVPIDISGDYLRDSAARVDAQFPQLPVHPVEADFTKDVILPAAIDGRRAARFLPRIDDRQFRAAQRDRPPAPLPRHPRRRVEAADRDGPRQAGRAPDRGV